MNENQDKYFTDLDKELQQLALVDWPAFVKLMGEDNITSAKVCLLKSRGKSQNQTAIKLNTTRETVRWACKKCPDTKTNK